MPRRNPAIARRGSNSARLTRGHASLPDVIAARETAEDAQAYHDFLGQGNFGIVYRGHDPRVRGDVSAVKFPAAMSNAKRPWSHSEQRDNLMHEAGVANELVAKGYRCVPKIVYTTLSDSTPVLVREFGEPVTAMTAAEFDALERELADIEMRSGWWTDDDMQLYRRLDGSIFIGDVGTWSKRASRHWSRSESSLDVWLGRIAKQFLGDGVELYFQIADDISTLRKETSSLKSAIRKPVRDEQSLAWNAGRVARAASGLSATAERRRAMGMSLPAGLHEAVRAAEKAIIAGGPFVVNAARAELDRLALRRRMRHEIDQHQPTR